jgi:putative ABC transport system permease protein
MENILKDIRYSFRMMRKNPAFTFAAILTLALGIGANTAIFSVVDAVLLNPFPYRDHTKLMIVRQSLPKIGAQEQIRASGPEFVEFREQTGVFEQAAAIEPVSRNLTGGQEPERISAAKVSADFFPMLGVQPEAGRAITAEDQGPKGERVLVISHGLWQRRFGGEEVLGQKISLDDEPYTVVGIMPQSFRFDTAEAWFPFPFEMREGPRSNGRSFLVLGRLKPGVSIDQASASLEVFARNQEQEMAGTVPEYEGRKIALVPLLEFTIGSVGTALLVLLGAVVMVLLIACANIANLLLARAVSREREIAIRSALGASRSRVVRQMLTESGVIAVLGGGLGLLIAVWSLDALVALVPAGSIPQGIEVSVDARVLVFTLAVSLATALVFGLWPALQASKVNLNESLKEGGQKTTGGYRNRRAQGLLVVAEVGLSLLLLIMAGLMLRSFARLTQIDPGFDPEKVVSMRINLPPARYAQEGRMAAFFQQLIERVETVPGVESAGVASHMPFVYTENWLLTVEGTPTVPAQTMNLDTRTVSPGYFHAMRIPFLSGETFSPQDVASAPGVVIINRSMARRFWSDEEAIGKRVKLGRADSNNPWMTVRAVVEDSAQGSLDVATNPEVYFPLAQMAGRYRRMNLAVRSTGGDPLELVGAIQAQVRNIDKDQPVYQIQTMDSLVADSVGTRRFAMMLLGLFAGLALLLAVIGIYGVMSYSVTQRTHEIGIRVALGAGRKDVLKLIVGQGLVFVVLGLAVGLAGAFIVTSLLARLLYGVGARDPLTFAAVTAILAAIALAACYLPARRASKVDPMVALRYE